VDYNYSRNKEKTAIPKQKRRCGFMSAVHALNGYREAQIINKRKELRRKAVHSLVSTVKMALAKQVPADWFRDPFFWELYDAQRSGSGAAEINQLFEKWGR
jgi:hypothetical protein